MDAMTVSVRTTVDSIAEATWNKFIRTILVPGFMLVGLPVLGWLITSHLTDSQEKVQMQITALQEKTQAQLNVLSQQFNDSQQDLAKRRESNQVLQTSLMSTLLEIQKAMVGTQATSAAQYSEIKARLDREDLRNDRQDDRFNDYRPKDAPPVR